MRLFFRLPRRRHIRRGFTLIEVLITVAILLVIMVTVAELMSSVQRTWKSAAADPFADAQDAFETVARNLSNATLAPYEDYADTHGAFRTDTPFIPDHIARRSDLAFACGPDSNLVTTGSRTLTGSAVFFVTPYGSTQTYPHQGMENLVNAMGYFVEFGSDDEPSFVPIAVQKQRWRLEAIIQPTESLQVFAIGTTAAWLQQLVPAGASLPVLADNVVTLLVLPERDAADTGPALAPTFSYDSRDTGNRLTLHQLPPRVRLVLVAMDEVSAIRLAAQNGSAAPQLVPASLFTQAAQLDADLASLDTSLAAQKINHRIFQREISLPSAAWSNTPSP